MPFADSPALRVRAVCLGLFLGTLLLFSRAMSFGFTNYDDPRYLTNNPHVQAGLTWEGLRWACTGKVDYWHPLTWISHMVDWQLYGDRAYGHHLTSALWHALNAVLVFLVARRLTGAFWTSALCAALFAWHPLRVESVVWITERKDVMSGFFFLLTVWIYTGYAEKHRANDASALRYYGLTLGAFACGLMCKPTLVALPVVLVLLDFWPLRRFASAAGAAPAEKSATWSTSARPWMGLLLEKVPLFLLSAAASVVTILLQEDTGAFTLSLPFSARLANAVVSVPRYLGKFFWPFNLTVCYPHPGHWPAAGVGAAGALVLAITGVAFWQWRSRPWLLTGWFWFLAMLLPVIGLVQAGFQAMADRYTYLPIIGLQLALLWMLRDVTLLGVTRWMRIGLAGLILAGCAARTWNQEKTWRNPITLFEHALAVTERNDMAHFFLGATLFAEGRINEAELHAKRAVEINPNYAADYDLLGDIQVKQGRIAEACDSYHRVLQLDPRNAKADYDLGFLLLLQNQPEQAAVHFQSAVRSQPESISAYLGLAQVETMLGRLPQACDHFRKAISLQPKSPAAHLGLALALEQLGRTDEALASYTTATQLSPGDAAAHVKIGIILLNRNQPAEARSHFEIAAKNQPNFGAA